MKKSRGLSVILCLAMILSVLNFPAYADSTVKAYITISFEGEIVKDKNGSFVAEAPVTLTGKESYTLDDVFKEAHELYYDGGADAGYATATSEWGLSVTKVWGDNSGKFGYQMNLGDVSVWGPTQAVNNGDYVDLCIYENYYPDTEAYAKFDAYKKDIDGDTAEFTLYESYYGENWETLFKPCEGATVLVNGVATDIKTDENGKCKLFFGEDGEYLISAKKTKIIKNAVTEVNETVGAITAPVCLVNVKISAAFTLLHNAVDKFVNGNLSEQDQMPWLLCDIAAYSTLYPNKKGISQENKQKCVDKIIPMAEEATSASDLAKAILALRAMGYDPKNAYNKNGDKVDIVAKLSSFIDNQSGGVMSIYTLPYVIMAMRGYAAETQMSALLTAAVNQKDGAYGWLDNSWGVDGATPMLYALAPYCDENTDVKNAVAEAVTAIQAKQSDSGAIICLDWNTSLWVDSAASTGLAIAGLSAIGTDPETVKNNGKSLIDGLMSLKTDTNDGFLASSFDTEQGLRGLVAWELYQNGKRIYDFSEYPQNAAYATKLEVAHSGGSSGGNKTDENETVAVTVKVMTHNENDCNNSYTYKANASKYKSIVSKTVEISKNETVYDATVKALRESGTSYEDRNGYIASIGDVSEFDHGQNSGWMFLLNGKHQNSGCKDITLTQNATVLWFYTDDYTRESGSENYTSPSSASEKTEKEPVIGKITEPSAETRVFESNTFADVKESDWHFSAVKFVYENNLMSGTDKGFEPNSKMTRAMFVTVLFRLSGENAEGSDIAFADVKSGEWYTDGILWAASAGIVSGIGNNMFAPDGEITREQMAVILYNFAMYKNAVNLEQKSEKITEFEDFNEISDYAKSAISWANAGGFITGESETVLNPKNSATRAQIASILMRYCTAEEE